jgi:hypothetical protein
MGSNPTGAWVSVCCECCVLSGRGLCIGLSTRPEESYRLGGCFEGEKKKKKKKKKPKFEMSLAE